MQFNWGKIKTKIGQLKYIITLVVFGVIIIFIDDNNLIKRYKNYRMIDEMQTEIVRCKTDARMNTMRLHRLQTDPRFIEKIAREKYLMKKPDEDVYVFEEK